jgi:O-antigen/teichoic acid export membrane protein
MTSFCTVLVPHITRFISEKANAEATKLYKLFLEITYISTGILCCAALAAAPELMELLYSNKYADGLSIFCVYILVDLFRFTNITIVLSAAGKTRRLMIMGLGAMVFNALLNVVLYQTMGLIGPAVATLVITIAMGVLMLCFSARVMDARFSDFFDFKYMIVFAAESLILTLALTGIRRLLAQSGLHYFVILVIIAGIYGIVMLLLNGKKLLGDMLAVNRASKENT